MQGANTAACCLPQASASAPAPSYHILQYSYVADILEKRGPYRADHLGAANKMVRRVELSRAQRRRLPGPLPGRGPDVDWL